MLNLLPARASLRDLTDRLETIPVGIDTNQMDLASRIVASTQTRGYAMTIGVGPEAAYKVAEALGFARMSWMVCDKSSDLCAYTEMGDVDTVYGLLRAIRTYIVPLHQSIVPSLPNVLETMRISGTTKPNKLAAAICFKIEQDGYALTTGVGVDAANIALKTLTVVRYFCENDSANFEVLCRIKVATQLAEDHSARVIKMLCTPVPSIMVPGPEIFASSNLA